MIPKLLHYCWFGPKEKTDSFLSYIETWKKYLPDFEIIEWNEKNFDVNFSNYTRECFLTGNYAHLSDVCRVFALYTMGGIYLDTDVELRGNLTPFMSLDSFIGLESDLVATAVVGSEKGAPWLKKFLDYYTSTHFINIWGHSVRTPNTTILTERILPSLPLSIWPTIFPHDYFCGMDMATGEVNVTDNTVAIHHFAASWRRRKTFSERIASLFRGARIRYFGPRSSEGITDSKMECK